MTRDLTASLLTAWREAERAAAVARGLSEQAKEAAEAAEAARSAAKEAGISLEAADVVVGKASAAYHQREADVAAHQVAERESVRPL